jgi:acyl-CoA thioesterase FadM
MNLWLRLLWLLLATPFRPAVDPREQASSLVFRVLPTDLDLNGHMNNGRYLSLMDLGRLDVVLRSGLWRVIWRNRWAPTLGGVAVRFHRELRPFDRFRIETRIAAWTESIAVMEQTFVLDGRGSAGLVAARALAKCAFHDRKTRSLVPMKRLVADLGVEVESPPPSPEIEAFLAADRLLRRAGGGD